MGKPWVTPEIIQRAVYPSLYLGLYLYRQLIRPVSYYPQCVYNVLIAYRARVCYPFEFRSVSHVQLANIGIDAERVGNSRIYDLRIFQHCAVKSCHFYFAIIEGCIFEKCGVETYKKHLAVYEFRAVQVRMPEGCIF